MCSDAGEGGGVRCDGADADNKDGCVQANGEGHHLKVVITLGADIVEVGALVSLTVVDHRLVVAEGYDVTGRRS